VNNRSRAPIFHIGLSFYVAGKITPVVRSYYSTFIPGLLQPVEEALRIALPDSKIVLSLDGLVAYESNAKSEVIQKLPFVTNSFYIIKRFAGHVAQSISNMAMAILNDRVLSFHMPVAIAPDKTFRVITSMANQLVPLDQKVMRLLESRITEKTGLRPGRSKPDFEFWLAQRTEGYGFFSFRISRHKAYDKILQKGELRPELANILCRLSDPSPNELFLDPFCGSGAIPIQRAKSFPSGLVIASDKDEGRILSLKDRIKALGLQKRVVVRSDDGLKLARYEDNSIHKIVTDPPWGHFAGTDMPIEEFYRGMVSAFVRVLRPDGKLVILTAEAQAMDAAIEPCKQLTISRKLNILLSGKKASIYVLSPKG
jgi:tRNA (guanine6-N2)-methyltransferase